MDPTRSTARRRLAGALLGACLAGTMALLASLPAGAEPATHLSDVERNYRRLLEVLQHSPAALSDPAQRTELTRASALFLAALKRDGSARDALVTDTRNIVASLGDGSFSAAGSIRALQRDAAAGNALQSGPWDPSTLPGKAIAAPIGINLVQKHEGDCVGISVVKAFSTTPTGKDILHRAVHQLGRDRYSVSLPGDPSRTYTLAADNLDQYGTGDPAAAAIVGAMFQYFHLDPAKGSLPTNKVMAVLAGGYGTHARLADRDSSSQDIVGFLGQHADELGSRVAMVFGGKPDRHGDWSKGDGHAFAVIRVDVPGNMVYYTNPWNESVVRKIALSDLASQAAGTSADFEFVRF
ncbi:hypothetical protein [Burkholderia gladioli]|uniref:hypothetical protein n=1 Tax=Burkholderia gladioli TaxID=28095 RepID=UPI0002F7B5FF|nr:hypothetical protein [Burkholderia gladioli]MBW5283259.1 hypothetical protein [Burkholderia gladioli]